MRKTVLTALTFAFTAGCGEKQADVNSAPEPVAAAPATAPAPPPKPPFTKTEWRSAYKAAFVETKPTSDDEGITSYGACFGKKDDGKCEVVAYGKRDAFRKIDHLTTLHTSFNRIGDVTTFLGTYLSAIECRPPSLLIRPSVNKKGGWLFMEKVSLMADGEVVLDREMTTAQIDRDNEGYWVHETGNFIATDEELTALEKFVNAEQKAIRITGQKGYLTLPKERTAEFAKDAKDALSMLASLNKSFAAAGGPVCSAPNDATAKN